MRPSGAAGARRAPTMAGCAPAVGQRFRVRRLLPILVWTTGATVRPHGVAAATARSGAPRVRCAQWTVRSALRLAARLRAAAALLRPGPAGRASTGTRAPGKTHVRRAAGRRRWAARRCCTWTISPRHEELFAWTERLRGPGARAAVAGARPRATPRTTGCARSFDRAARAAARAGGAHRGRGRGPARAAPALAWLLWMELAREDVLGAGTARDGPGARASSGTAGSAAERAHFADGPLASVRRFPGAAGTEGYEVLAGPAGTAVTGPRSSRTVTDRRPCADSERRRQGPAECLNSA